MRFKIIYVLVALISFACKTSEEDLVAFHMTDDLRLEQLSDSTFLSDIRSIVIDSNTVYLADFFRSQVIEMDEEGSVISIIGQMGRGPEELLHAMQLYLKNDTLYVISAGENTMKVFNKGLYIRTIHYNKQRGGYAGGRFFVDKGYIFMSMPGFDGSISVLPLWNKLDVRSFGEVIPFSSERQTRFQNHRHIFLHNNFVISVSRTHPMIERYSKEGDLIEIFSYQNLPLLEELNQHIQSQPSVENVTINVVCDAYISGDLLYLLLYTRENERPQANKILVLDLGGGKIKLQKLLDIGPGRFAAIGVSEEYIWAFRSDRHMMYLSRFPIESIVSK